MILLYVFREGTTRFGGQDTMLLQITPVFRVVQGQISFDFRFKALTNRIKVTSSPDCPPLYCSRVHF